MDKNAKRNRRKSKKVCPKCGGNSIASILRGYPIFSEKLDQDIRDGKVVLGGCCVMDNDPKWHCNKCENEW
jgi:hypothetical protein